MVIPLLANQDLTTMLFVVAMGIGGHQIFRGAANIQTFCPNFLLFFQTMYPSETDFCPAWGAAVLLLSSSYAYGCNNAYK